MIVLTVDQRASTTRGDLVPVVLDVLHACTHGPDGPVDGLVLPFERTVGDEVQGVLAADQDGAELAVELVEELVRDGGWSVGVGVGAVDEPLPDASRAASGPAFVRARAAVEQAKRKGLSVPLALSGAEGEPAATVAADAEALLRLCGAVTARRSVAGWEAVDTLGEHPTSDGPQRAAAEALGISEQAVSQRLRTALWHETEAVRPLVVRLVAAADTAATAADVGADVDDEG
ncbi:helix-turn-helix domain-containing protein [Isoptericola chiayiensis]|uniref:Helix-turn-helix domain-containing protein n=1 Tax=Isoptericola chiayiensis TaxID=579446 RepID=A0ABP8YGG3_9MICO|nr:hypothetical protein [Isoptericola chiayiensis]NOW00028.1 hypothetical protein [Isoptericola chiayiensis]